MSDISTVAVVDDDPSVRTALRGLLRSAGYQVDTYDSAEDFLQSGRHSTTACLVLDIRMPGINGMELQDRLRGVAAGIPIIFMTAHADSNVRQRAIKAGAIGFLQKPFSDEAVLAAIQQALAARA